MTREYADYTTNKPLTVYVSQKDVPYLLCPICHGGHIVRMPDDWHEQVERGAAIPIIGCGNPWHYANMDYSNDH